MSEKNISSNWFDDCLAYAEWLHSISDPRVSEWPLMSSPWPTLAIFAAYMGFVHCGPQAMRLRQPFQLKPLMVGYNLSIAALNLYIFQETYSAATSLNYSYVCQKVVYSYHPDEVRIAKVVWWFYISKAIELLDTVFLVLRKKNDQLSFLHVYHHATMVLFWYIGVRWVAGGSAFFPTLTNSCIHVLMYSYYGLAAMGPKIQKFLWWKKYLTQIQMGQFLVGIYFGVQSFYITCEFPLWMKYAFIAYMASLFALFSNFYVKRYYRGLKFNGFLLDSFCCVSAVDIPHENGKRND